MAKLGSLPTLASVASTLVLLGLAATAHAKPRWLRLSYVEDPSTSATVSWNTTADVGTNVKWGTDPKNLDHTATGTSQLANATLGYVHQVEMTGLAPSTRYFYSVGDDGDGWSAVFTFTTAPPQDQNCSKFRFIFLGDNRPDKTVGLGDNWESILGEAANYKPLFVMNGGDLVYDGKKSDQWRDFLGWTTSQAQYIPFMPVMGNHDDDSKSGDEAQYNKIFALPRSKGPGSSGTEDYYFFEVGNAIFVVLNTQLYTSKGTFKDQATWLDDVLTHHPKQWKFVLLHHPIYTADSVFSHGPNEKGQNPALVPIIDKHHVDIVFQSHNHWYERFEPSNCTVAGKPGSTKACSVGKTNYAGGTVYITSGGAGALTIPYCGNATGRAKCDTKHHIIIFDIDNNRLHMETWRTAQQSVGNNPSNRKKIDVIDIVKPPVQCGTNPDGGVPDGGASEAGPDQDAGTLDASHSEDAEVDAGTETDTGSFVDAGAAGHAGEDATVPNGDAGDSASESPSSASDADSGNSGSCSCSAPGHPSPGNGPLSWLVVAMGVAFAAARRSRRS